MYHGKHTHWATMPLARMNAKACAIIYGGLAALLVEALSWAL